MVGKICGTGSYVPAHVMTNDDLARIVDTNDEWIRERTGISRRHIIEEETTSYMAGQAARRALEQSGIDPEEIDMILLATSSSETVYPCAACEVQKMIGAKKAVGYDLNAACSGFVLAFNAAQAYISAGFCRTVLVVGAESMSTGLSRHRKDWEKELEDDAVKESFIHMDGQAVFKFAVRKVPEIIEEILEGSGTDQNEIDYFILHQANRRIIEAVAKRLKADITKFPMDLEEYANTSAATVPILLDEMNRKGMLKRGQKIMTAGFGAGLTWAACLFEW